MSATQARIPCALTGRVAGSIGAMFHRVHPIEPFTPSRSAKPMRPAGYMAKFVASKPEWLACADVADVFSVSGCVSADFCDYIDFWAHNGYWFFDDPSLVQQVAEAAGVELAGSTLFYYEAYELEFDQKREEWKAFDPEQYFPVAVQRPATSTLEGFDVVSFYARSTPECSPLSCNGLACHIPVNSHCLLGSLSEAVAAMEAGHFKRGEPGSLRVFSVHTVPWNAR